jgi:hypothetical protein
MITWIQPVYEVEFELIDRQEDDGVPSLFENDLATLQALTQYAVYQYFSPHILKDTLNIQADFYRYALR